MSDVAIYILLTKKQKIKKEENADDGLYHSIDKLLKLSKYFSWNKLKLNKMY